MSKRQHRHPLYVPNDTPLLPWKTSAAADYSRSTTRALALKLAEASLIRDESGELPILLLDDVLSELDDVHRVRLVGEVMAPGCQVIVTSTEVGSLAEAAIAYLPLAEVHSGAVAFL